MYIYSPICYNHQMTSQPRGLWTQPQKFLAMNILEGNLDRFGQSKVKELVWRLWWPWYMKSVQQSKPLLGQSLGAGCGTSLSPVTQQRTPGKNKLPRALSRNFAPYKLCLTRLNKETSLKVQSFFHFTASSSPETGSIFFPPKSFFFSAEVGGRYSANVFGWKGQESVSRKGAVSKRK